MREDLKYGKVYLVPPAKPLPFVVFLALSFTVLTILLFLRVIQKLGQGVALVFGALYALIVVGFIKLLLPTSYHLL